MKRLISLLIGFSLIASLMVACGTTEETESISTPSEEVQETIVEESTSPEVVSTEPETISDEENKEIMEEDIPKFVDKKLKSSTKYRKDDTELDYQEFNTDGILIYEKISSYEYDPYNSIHEYTYDNNGNLLTESDNSAYENDDDYYYDYHEYTYNENGDISIHYWQYGSKQDDSLDNEESYDVYYYDDKNTLIGEVEWWHGKTIYEDSWEPWNISSARKYEYNDDKTIEKIYSWYTYDDNESSGILSINDISDDKWEYIEYYEYTYYDNGDIKTIETYDVDNMSLTSWEDYEYTDNGYIITKYKGDGEVNYTIECETTYWNNGNIKTDIKKTSKSGTGIDTYNNEYDYCGNIISDGEYTYEYTYDEAGNKLTEKETGNGVTNEYTYVNEYYD